MTIPLDASLDRRQMMVAAVEVCRLTWHAAPLAVTLYVLATLVSAALPVAAAWLTKAVLDRLVVAGWDTELLVLGASLAITGLLAAALPHLAQYLRAEVGRATALTAEDRLFGRIEGFIGLARFEDPRFLDRLRLALQGAAAPGQLVDDAFGLLRGVLVFFGLVGSLTAISPVMTALLLATALPMVLIEVALSRQRAAMFWKLGPTERREIFYRSLLESVHAAKEIRLFGTARYFRGRMLGERRTANAAKRRMDGRELAMQGGLAALGALAACGGLVWAVRAAATGGLSIGDVSMFLAALAGVQGAVQSAAQGIGQAHRQLLFFDHYVNIMRAEPDLPVARQPASVPALSRGIELRDVWFRYSDDHPWILKGVNLFIPQGMAVALVGLNGAGKSTLVKLLCRFYDPDKGAIHWDGIDLRDLDAAELRQRIGAVFQDYMDYDVTAAENIALGDLAAMDDRPRIETAAKRAGVHEALTGLPRGYDTLLTRMFFGESEEGDPETGVRLSGGQWQRLALARAFLRDKRDLMILDEPSAGLDAEAEYEVHARLAEHRHGRTSILISHRLGSVRDADLIVVLADGVVEELGDHETLINADGTYARLFQRQAQGYQSAAEKAQP